MPPGATKAVVVVVVMFGREFEENEEDCEEEAEERGIVRSCAEMALAILLKTGLGSLREEELTLPFAIAAICSGVYLGKTPE